MPSWWCRRVGLLSYRLSPNHAILFVLYIMLLLTETSFWTSELGLLTSNWTRSSSISQMQEIYYRRQTRPRFLWSAGKGNLCFAERDLNALWGSGDECIICPCLPNVQSLENKWDEVKARISFERDIKNCNIWCFTESWLNAALPRPPFGKYDHNYILLIPAYRQKFKQEALVTVYKKVVRWSRC